jgi:phosphoglycolate phosphatase/putative hydrolase of the HAD superfamily
MTSLQSFDLHGIRAVIFDVDGTLYDLKMVQRIMLFRLARFYIVRPWRCYDVFILYKFRRNREEMSVQGIRNIEREQFSRVAAKTGASETRVRSVVGQWIIEAPLPFLRRCRYEGVDEFFGVLRKSGVRVAAMSDYPATAKIAALGLKADAIVSAVDPSVDRFKPDPAGFLTAARMLAVEPKDVLVIGDRMDRDGIAAERAGMRCLLIDEAGVSGGNCFKSYMDLIPLMGERSKTSEPGGHKGG